MPNLNKSSPLRLTRQTEKIDNLSGLIPIKSKRNANRKKDKNFMSIRPFPSKKPMMMTFETTTSINLPEDDEYLSKRFEDLKAPEHHYEKPSYFKKFNFNRKYFSIKFVFLQINKLIFFN